MLIDERVKIMVIYFREDDPKKNTSLKMIRYGIAYRIHPRKIRGYPVVLNPYAINYLGRWCREYIEKYGLVVLDASWKKLSPTRFKGIRGKHYKLPPLLPGNPVNYGKPCILSSIEAVAASLYITGFKNIYNKLIKLYKWMNTFHKLNQEILEEYSKAEKQEELEKTIKKYWENPPC
ncbi:MAG: hypothetical protein B6U89_00280 [Desulfurococcales archaeon ex4484_58]|nr:MAG: hypothetical protein B6U89_00280 [Desulfurococcales archaeon ex4484_58]